MWKQYLLLFKYDRCEPVGSTLAMCAPLEAVRLPKVSLECMNSAPEIRCNKLKIVYIGLDKFDCLPRNAIVSGVLGWMHNSRRSYVYNFYEIAVSWEPLLLLKFAYSRNIDLPSSTHPLSLSLSLSVPITLSFSFAHSISLVTSALQ